MYSAITAFSSSAHCK